MFDEKDQLILDELKKNARQTTKKIATKLKIPRVTVHDRIRKMEQKGVIKSYTVIPDYEKVGLPSKAFIFVSLRPSSNTSERKLAKKIAQFPNVYEVHVISGEYDLLIKVRGKILEKTGNLVFDHIRKIEGVERTLTFASFETIKEEI